MIIKRDIKYWKMIQMKLFDKKPYQNVIDFIDAAVDSDDLRNWLKDLEKLPNNLRQDHLNRMKRQMIANKEPEKIIDIVNSINKLEILSAVNLVIHDVYETGKRTEKYLGKYSNENFNVLISLLVST